MISIQSVTVAWLLVATSACMGEIPAGDGPGAAANGAAPAGAIPGSSAGPSGGKAVAPGPSAACASVPAPLRRLSNFEYVNTVHDLFPGYALGGLATDLIGDNVRDVFDNDASVQAVVLAVGEGYSKAAERVSAEVTGDLRKLLGCDPGSDGGDACFASFLQQFAPRAFRRAVTAEEEGRISATFAANKQAGGLRIGVQAALERILQSPQFLYRIESPGNGPLSAYDAANRLSYFFWASMPDAELLASARSGALSGGAELQRQASRLLADPRARQGIGHFYGQWLDLDGSQDVVKDAKLFPAFTPEIATLMHQEMSTFVEQMTWGADGRWDWLFAAPFTYANRKLATYYGLTAPAGDAFERVSMDARRQAGILVQGAYTTQTAKDKETSPVARGKFVRTRLLCDALPPPPPNVPALPAIKPNQTTRQRLVSHSTDPACSGCHTLIDPIGFGLENMDPVGRWRDLDNGQPVDSSGQVNGGGDAGGAFQGPAELGHRLAGSTYAASCLVKQVARFALGRDVSGSDVCLTSALAAKLKASASVKDLLIGLATSDLFVSR